MKEPWYRFVESDLAVQHTCIMESEEEMLPGTTSLQGAQEL